MQSANRPRLLLVAPMVPDANGVGLSMRLSVFADALARLGEVDTIVVPVFDADAILQQARERGVAAIDTRGRQDTLFSLLARISDPDERLRQFLAYGRGSRHAVISSSVVAELRARLDRRAYALAHFGRLYLADAVAALPPGVSATLDFDEDDALGWQLPMGNIDPHVRAWHDAEAVAEDRLISRRAASFDALFIAGDADRQTILERHPGLAIDIVENAIAFPSQADRRDDGQTLLFVGTMGYAPNREGVAWFLDQVWPELRARHGDRLHFHIVGRAMPEAFRRRHGHDGIDIVADAPDVAPHYAAATLAIAPLFSGRGTRLKLIEAAAYAVPVVATSAASAGLPFSDPQSMWIAEDKDTFIAAVSAALASPVERSRRAKQALDLARRRHDRELVVSALAQRLSLLLESRKDRGLHP